jgi:hypothetical protein
MSDKVSGPFNGEKIALDTKAERVCFVLQPDSNLTFQYDLYHKDASASTWKLVSAANKPAIALDISVSELLGDKLGWRVACAALNLGSWPVHAQLFQSKGGAYVPVSRIARYELSFPTADEVLQGFFDEVQFT